MLVVGKISTQSIIMYIKGRFRKYMIGASIVEMNIEKHHTFEIISEVNGINNSHSQGQIIDVPVDDSYLDWKQGAEIGIKYAAKKLNILNIKVRISSIQGLDTDTNPTIVAFAAINGIYQYHNYEISDIELQKMFELGKQSWLKEFNHVPSEFQLEKYLC
jgi:hypothetical protein